MHLNELNKVISVTDAIAIEILILSHTHNFTVAKQQKFCSQINIDNFNMI